MKLNKKIKFNNLKQVTIPVIIFVSRFKRSAISLGLVICILFIALLYLNLNLFGLTLGLITITSLTIIYARHKNTTVPFLGKIIKQQYFNTRFKILNLTDTKNKTLKSKTKLYILKKYQKVLFYFILVLKNSEDGYHVVKEEVFCPHRDINLGKLVKGQELIDALTVIEKIKANKTVGLGALEMLDTLLLRLYKQRQKKVARLSAS